MANFNQVYNFIARDRFSGAVTGITNKNTRLNRSIKKTNVKLKKLSRRFNFAGKAAKSLKGGVAKLAATFIGLLGISKASEMVANFEDNLLDLSAITGAIGPDLKFLEKSAFELGKTFGAEDGHKYVNGILDKVAQKLRAVEVKAATK